MYPVLHYGLDKCSEHGVLKEQGAACLRVLSLLAAAGPSHPRPLSHRGRKARSACRGAAFQAGLLSGTAFLETHKQLPEWTLNHNLETQNMLTDRCCPRSLQKCLTSINLPLPPLEKLFVFCFLN